ncbi:HpcH/HpaI aldolase family protein [Halopelagius longus]|uniref:Aldolase n=1 Tax=Halopelagius longus TaxID=1236180 RepID=A0A1H1FFH3_9EURY|nr:aldolase/citrate lyase family protein [Halopelagius longus]RDI70118.1 aldolase [Halopelagius longus]SDQ99863.1 2-dehydro-3-deoxyglucarate aldolase/4-hydroxy-2-oxoheptanedioate aldolase [Halopelagius longus]
MTEDGGLARIAEATEPSIGTWVTIPAPETAELLAGLGYDFVSFDQEHTPMSYETMGNLLRAADAAPGTTESLVRVADDDPTTLKRTLDLDPTAILVPMVETAEQAEEIVDASRYPPEGRRGLGLTRASGYGRSLSNHVETAEDELARFVQLESERAVENADAIATVDGIDGLFVGPVDLSLSMGRLGEWDDAEFLERVDSAIEAARDADAAVGTFATSADQREARLDWGVDFLVAGVDATHLAEGASAALDHAEGLVRREE